VAAKFFPRPWLTAATAESLTAAQARQARETAAPLIPSLIAYANDPANAGGFDEAALKAGFTELAALSDGQVRAILRVLAVVTDSVYA